jgi:drug/metabolite transporter (DMT)-like permease
MRSEQQETSHSLPPIILLPTSGRSQTAGMRAGLVTDMAQNARNASTWIGVPVVIVGVLGLLVLLSVEGRLNPQTFAISCVIVMALAVVIWTVLLKRANRPVQSPDEVASAGPRHVSKKKALQVALLLLFLMAAFWMTRGGPWVPRLIGASMLVLLITGTVLRKAR